METVSCYNCSYPIAAQVGQAIKCPYCSTAGKVEEKVKEVNMLGIKSPQIANGVTIPTWLAAGLGGLLFGVILGPAIITSTKTGSESLSAYATKRITQIGR